MSRLVAFWSPSGAGASTLLLNTAAALGARRVNLAAADLNLTAPSLALYADLLPYEQPQSACLSRLLPALDGGRLTVAATMQQMLPAPGGFAMLPGMLDIVAASRLTETHVRQLIRLLLGRFDLVLADLMPPLDSVACLPVLEMADLICLVVGPEIASRFHARRHLLPLRAMGWEEKTALILNRAGSISEAQVSDDVGLQVAAAIPELKGMAGFIEAGRIALTSQSLLPGAARFRSAVERLATLMTQAGSGHAQH